MKKKVCMALIVIAASYMLQSCGSAEEHVIEKESASSAFESEAEDTEDLSADKENQTENMGRIQEDTQQGNGYCFVYSDVRIYVDEDMSVALEELGEPNSYFEAASCAFENELDKTYTYSGFQIITYPTDDRDWISCILLQDDTVKTQEGIRIGSSFDDVLSAYGTEYTEDGSMMIYEKDGMELCFVVEEEKVTSVQYISTVME